MEPLETRWLPSTVINLSDSGPGSLRQAILDTSAGNTVDFQPGLTGTITLTTGQLVIDKDLTISGPGADKITVSGNSMSRVFAISPVTVTLSGLTVADGSIGPSTGDSLGGGIFNEGTLTLEQMVVTNNEVLYGANTLGGGIYSTGVLSLTLSVVSNNEATGQIPPTSFGGGIYSTGTLTVTSSDISGNFVRGPVGSFSSARGGGISANGAVTIGYSTIADNFLGGGIYLAGGSLNVTNSTISDNSIGDDGGGIAVFGGTVSMLNCTVAGNKATDHSGPLRGGGILNAGGTVTMKNSLVAANVGTGDVWGSFVTSTYNLIGNDNGSSGLVNGVNGNQVGTPGSPINPKLGVLKDNGGPTRTQALLPGSPAIDAGTNAGVPPTDQRFLPRPSHWFTDVGSFEVQIPAYGFFAAGGAPGRAQVLRTDNGAVVGDFAPFGSSYSGRVSVAVGDLNGDGVPDIAAGKTDGQSYVKIYSGVAFAKGTFNPGNPDANLIASFDAYDAQFAAGVNLVIGSLGVNTACYLITGAASGNPHVKVFRGADIAAGTFDPAGTSLIASFFAYGLQFNVGVNVGVGKLHTESFPSSDLVTGASRGNPHVKVYNGERIAVGTFNNADPDASLITQFFAYELGKDLGANVAVIPNPFHPAYMGDLATGASSGNPHVKVFWGADIDLGTFDPVNPDASLRGNFFAYDLGFDIGAIVAGADFDGNGQGEVLTGTTTGNPQYRVVRSEATGIKPPALLEAILTGITGGISVGA